VDSYFFSYLLSFVITHILDPTTFVICNLRVFRSPVSGNFVTISVLLVSQQPVLALSGAFLFPVPHLGQNGVHRVVFLADLMIFFPVSGLLSVLFVSAPDILAIFAPLPVFWWGWVLFGWHCFRRWGYCRGL